jgi:hypothetical protein
MATVKIPLSVVQLVPASSNGPQFKIVDGTNAPVSSLAFDASTAETAFAQFQAINYGSGNLTLILDWYADTASSGDVKWEAALAAITPDTDTQDVETKAFATAQTVTDSHLGTTGQRVHTCSIAISNLDSLAANDDAWLRIKRLSADAADTMTGDAQLLAARLEYSDT